MPSRMRSGSLARLSLLDQAHRAHDLAGRAEAALESVMGDEGGLHRMKRVASGEAFDGDDLRAVQAQRKSEARIDPPAVDENRAGAALPSIAAFLGSGQVEALAQEIEKRHARVFKVDVSSLTVHGEADGEVHARLQSSSVLLL